MLLNNKRFSGFSPDRRAVQSYQPLYHADTVNHCPGCGRTHWHVGRSTAECAFCDTALPLAASVSQPPAPLFWFRGSSTAMPVAA